MYRHVDLFTEVILQWSPGACFPHMFYLSVISSWHVSSYFQSVCISRTWTSRAFHIMFAAWTVVGLWKLWHRVASNFFFSFVIVSFVNSIFPAQLQCGMDHKPLLSQSNTVSGFSQFTALFCPTQVYTCSKKLRTVSACLSVTCRCQEVFLSPCYDWSLKH